MISTQPKGTVNNMLHIDIGNGIFGNIVSCKLAVANFSVDRTGPVIVWTSPRLLYALEIFYFVSRDSQIAD